jgi:hypothetical protein
VTDTDGHEAYEDHASDPMADSRDRCAMQGGRLGIEPLLRQPDHVDLQAVIERKVTAAEVSFSVPLTKLLTPCVSKSLTCSGSIHDTLGFCGIRMMEFKDADSSAQ